MGTHKLVVSNVDTFKITNGWMVKQNIELGRKFSERASHLKLIPLSYIKKAEVAPLCVCLQLSWRHALMEPPITFTTSLPVIETGECALCVQISNALIFFVSHLCRRVCDRQSMKKTVCLVVNCVCVCSVWWSLVCFLCVRQMNVRCAARDGSGLRRVP